MKFTNFGKKLFAFIAVLTFGLVLVSCGGGNDKEKAQHQANVEAVVGAINPDQTALEEVKSKLAFMISQNAKYPDVKIEWTSSEPDLINTNGEVTRPALDDSRAVDGKVKVTLTVTATQGEAKASRTYEAYVLGEKTLDKNSIKAAKVSFYQLMQEQGVKYNEQFADTVQVEFTAKVLLTTSGSFVVTDGTDALLIYAAPNGIAVGDTVKVSGNLCVYYGLLEVKDATFEKVDAQDFAALTFAKTTVGEYTAKIAAALDANGKITNPEAFCLYSTAPLNLYAKLVKVQFDEHESYALQDPNDASKHVIIYYTSISTEGAATLDSFVGKYINIDVYTNDTKNATYRVLYAGTEIKEAAAPDLTDAQKVASALASCSVATTLTEDLTLPVVDGVAWTLKETYAAATIEAGVLKVTRPANGAGNATVVLVATASFGAESDSKEFELTITELPKEVEAGETLVSYEIKGAMPEGLTYITNNEKYPDPSFYGDGGLKMNYVNQAVQTGTFEVQSSVVVVLTVNKLNDNEKTNGGKDAFTVYGLNANGEVVATAGLENVVVGTNAVVLTGEGIVTVKVVMTDYTAGSAGKCANVNLGGVVVAKAE